MNEGSQVILERLQGEIALCEGCEFQPKHASLHPNQLPSRPHFLQEALQGLSIVWMRHSHHTVLLLELTGPVHYWCFIFWVACLKPSPWACALRMLMTGWLNGDQEPMSEWRRFLFFCYGWVPLWGISKKKNMKNSYKKRLNVCMLLHTEFYGTTIRHLAWIGAGEPCFWERH